ncbi:MAG TPA: SPFH domain-containing protein [Planctomycetota bacterium]|nr:SPFH domain-containing protein [Planctomycetota bacterium]
MGLWDKLRGELIDIVQWTEDRPDTLVHRFERYGNEIKHGAKLVVREGQAAVFVNEGKLADVFRPGTFTLETRNLPILSTLLGWKYGFESPIKAEVYFVTTRVFTDQKWGTKNPIMLRDPEFGPVRLRAFGTYTFRVTEPGKLIQEVVGTDGRFASGDIAEQLRNMIVARFSDGLGESKIPMLDLAGKYDELGAFMTGRIGPEFASYGLEISKFLVENISLPPEVEAALDKRSSMGIIGNLNAYTQFQAANALTDAAKNPGGAAAGGMGMGMGVIMAGQLGQSVGAAGAQQAAVPPPLPAGPAGFFVGLGGQQSGPFDLAALRGMASAGQLRADTLVWRAGMAQWTPAGQVAEIAALLGQSPPPLPK